MALKHLTHHLTQSYHNQPSLLQKIARSDKSALFLVRPFPSFAAAATLPRQQTGVIAAVGTAYYFVL